MTKVSKDAYVTGACTIIAAILGAWFGSVFGQGSAETELKELRVEHAELQREYEELANNYQILLESREIKEQSEFEGIKDVVVENEFEEITDTVVETEKKAITLFDLGIFTEGKTKKVTYIKDVFGNEYTEAFEIGTTVMKEEYMFDYDYVTEFFLNKEYNKFSCKVFFPEEAYEAEKHQLLIWGDGKQLGVVTIEKKSGTQSIEVDVENVDYLQFAAVTEERHSGSSLGIIEPYLEK